MTLIPPGAQLGPADLPPPPPSADPREPSPTAIRGRSSRTPQRARSPGPVHYTTPQSRGTSPSRPFITHNPSSDGSLPIIQPTPKHASASATSTSTSSASPIAPPPLNAHHSAPHLSRPSSPSSIHSSSSAIFERDIELPAVASLSINPNQPIQHTLSHKASRLSQLSHGSPLESTVPAVLDDAVEALQGVKGAPRGIEGLEIEAPAPIGSTGMARQPSATLASGANNSGRKQSIGPGAPGAKQFGSRSPSPVSVASRRSSGVVSPTRSPPILAQLATQQAGTQSAATSDSTSPTSLVGGLAGNATRPTMPQRLSTGPQLPGGWAFGHAGASEKPSEAVIAEAPASSEEATGTAPVQPAHVPSPPPAIPSHLTPTKDKRRISFISYNDLLLSVPTTVTPLGEITSGALSPDHLPGTVSPTVPTRSPVIPSACHGSAQIPNITGSKDAEHQATWEVGGGARPGGLGLGEGEWEREGLGKGLEQRLEDLVREDSARSPAGSPPLQS
ncbi:hypothetical protein DB88DRAFT_60503 [Papiliotrema laurentii]|uniref:Uncharacterized protein n=1 Tax=Papiliotrema laurentii TaxID=5418 RepID=A0AAD9FXS2_PAPLA|nr:hypothetical protein DB88DRAFT_60503 [Papiliotrema laurentii]